MEAEYIVALCGLALILILVSLYLDSHWHPDESRMHAPIKAAYRAWKLANKSVKVLVGIIIVLDILYMLGQSAYERWLPHDVPHDTVLLQSEDSAALFVAFDRKCASEYADSLHAEGFEAKERLNRIKSTCGIQLQDGDSAILFRKDGHLFQVEIASGDNAFRFGWIPESIISHEKPHS